MKNKKKETKQVNIRLTTDSLSKIKAISTMRNIPLYQYVQEIVDEKIGGGYEKK